LGYRFKESQFWGNNFGQQLWGTTLGSSFGEQLWGKQLWGATLQLSGTTLRNTYFKEQQLSGRHLLGISESNFQ